MQNRWARLGSALFCSALAVACGDDEPAGVGVSGRVEITIIDHPGQTDPSQPAGTPTTAPPYSGTLTTNANVSVSADGQTWRDVGSPNGITIPLQSTQSTTVHGEVDLPAGSFSQVRLTLRNAQALVRAGARIGTLTLGSDVLLAVGGSDNQIVVQKQVRTVNATANQRVQIVFDLNSEAWITTANAQDRVVDDAEVQNATQVAVR